MDLTIFAGSANLLLAESIASEHGLRLGHRSLQRFPDGELHVELQDSIRGHDVYIIQPMSPPVDENLMDLLFLADASRRAGAARLTAIVPYLAYARQDRRATGRESVSARLVADLISTSGFNRLVAIDLHSPALEGFFGIPLEHLSAVPILAQAVATLTPAHAVIVAPDLGAVKMAERYAKLLGLPMAIVHKTRISGEAVEAHGIVGEVRGRSPIVVDDMITTGATVEAAVKAVLAAGSVPPAVVVSSHALLVGPAVERLRALPLTRLIVTDSVSVAAGVPLPIKIVGLSPLLAEAIKRLHESRSLSHLIAHG